MFLLSHLVLREHFLFLQSGPSSVCLHWGLRLLDSTLLLRSSKYSGDLSRGGAHLGASVSQSVCRLSSLCRQDLIIFPDDCEFKRVPQCPSGRVYVLKFKAGSKRLFFWMQVSRRVVCSIFSCDSLGVTFPTLEGADLEGLVWLRSHHCG